MPQRRATAVRWMSRDGGAAGKRQAERLRDRGHRARRAHDHAGARGRREAPGHRADGGGIDRPGAVLRPEAAAIGAGAEPLAVMRRRQHRADRHDDRRQVDAGDGHQLRGDRLVAAADRHHGIHRLRAQHLLGVHRHEVAQVHAGGIGEGFVQRHGREDHRQPARAEHAALDRLDQLRRRAVAGVVVGAGVRDADDRALERLVAVAHRADEGLAQEEGEFRVAIGRQALPHADAHVVLH